MHILKFYAYFLFFFFNLFSVILKWLHFIPFLYFLLSFASAKSGTKGKIQEKRRWKIPWQQKNFYGKKVNNWNSSLAKHMEQERQKKPSTPTCFNFSLFFHQFATDIIKQPFGPCFTQHVLGKADDFMPLKSSICSTSSLHRCSHQCSNHAHSDWPPSPASCFLKSSRRMTGNMRTQLERYFLHQELGWRPEECSWGRDAPKATFSTPVLLPGSLQPTQPDSIVQAWGPSLATSRECCNECWFARASVFEIISRNTLQVVEGAERRLFL